MSSVFMYRTARLSSLLSATFSVMYYRLTGAAGYTDELIFTNLDVIAHSMNRFLIQSLAI